LNTIYEERKAIEKTSIFRKELIGEWSGKVIKSEDEELKLKEKVKQYWTKRNLQFYFKTP